MTELSKLTSQAVNVPWSAWHDETEHELLFPSGWSIDRLQPRPARPWTDAEIVRALGEPIDSPPLVELARDVRSVCIAVDDLTRPTRAGRILPHLLDELGAAGIGDEAIRLVVATGAHGRPDQRAVAAKMGAVAAARLQVEVHDPEHSVVETAIEYGGRPLRVNRTFLEAELKIGVGSVLPHPFAGYSGGAKLLLPGLADLAATERSHRFVRMGLRGGSDPNENGFRREIERIARVLGYQFCVCCVPLAYGETSGVFAGDLVAAHRRACQVAACGFETRVEHTYDCLIVNAYPKDGELVQADSALLAVKRAARPVVRAGGAVVLATAATCGLGSHALFGPGGLNYREPSPRRDFADRELWLYAPSASAADVRQLYWKGVPFFDRADQLCEALQDRFGAAARAGVLPYAPLQQVVT